MTGIRTGPSRHVGTDKKRGKNNRRLQTNYGVVPLHRSTNSLYALSRERYARQIIPSDRVHVGGDITIVAGACYEQNEFRGARVCNNILYFFFKTLEYSKLHLKKKSLRMILMNIN